MAARGTVASITLLLFASISGFTADPVQLKTALEGDNITLHCILDDQGHQISQIEWIKKENLTDHKMIIYHPIYGAHGFWANVTAEAVVDQGQGLRGAHLHLPGVQIGDSGLYHCDLSTYPHGSIRVSYKLEVRGPTLETLLSNSTTDQHWSLNGSESSHPTSLPSHTRISSTTDTSSKGRWTSALHTNLTLSKPELSDVTTAATNHSVSLDDITSSSAADMSIPTLPVTRTILDPSVNSSDLSIKTNETTQESTLGYPSHGPTTAPPPVQSESTNPSTNQSDTSQWNQSVWSTVVTEPGSSPQTSRQPPSPSGYPEEEAQTAAATRSRDPNTTESSGSQRYAALVILPVIPLIILLGVLYRRYQVQKMMDLPPPFKPPPPPLKYSAVRMEI